MGILLTLVGAALGTVIAVRTIGTATTVINKGFDELNKKIEKAGESGKD